MQDHVTSESVVATPRSGGGNLGTRGHDAGHLSLRGLIFGTRILLHMHVFVCASMCEFQGQNSIKRGRM